MKNKNKEYYDKNSNHEVYNVGYKVLINSVNLKELELIWSGPYEVIQINSDVDTTIKVNRRNKKIHNNLIKLFNCSHKF